jgi:hypothetical protein
MKIPLWQLQVMINLAHTAGAKDDTLIDFATPERGKGFLLTAPVEPDDLASAA